MASVVWFRGVWGLSSFIHGVGGAVLLDLGAGLGASPQDILTGTLERPHEILKSLPKHPRSLSTHNQEAKWKIGSPDPKPYDPKTLRPYDPTTLRP